MPYFPKIFSLMFFGNSEGNLYRKLFMLDIKFHFTCGLSCLYLNVLKLQNIIINNVDEKQENKVYRKKTSRENKTSESPCLREDNFIRLRSL